MLPAIDFYNESRRMTPEVREESPDGGLPTEVRVRQMAKTLPKFTFGISGVLTKRAGAQYSLI